LRAHQMRKQAKLISASVGALVQQQRERMEATEASDRPAQEESDRKELQNQEEAQREELEIAGEKEHAALLDKQLDQVFNFVAEVAPEYMDRIQDERHAAQVHAEMEAAKRQSESEVSRKMEALMEGFADKKEEELEAELEKMEAEMRSEEQKEMSKMSKKMSQIAARKQHALAQMKREHEIELEVAPKEKQKSLQNEHADKMRQLSAALDEEERKQQEAMQARVAQRANDRRHVRRMALEQKNELEYKVKETSMREEQERQMAAHAKTMADKEKELEELQSRLQTTTAKGAGTKFAALKRTASMQRDHNKIRLDQHVEQSGEDTQARKVAEAVTQPLMERMEHLEKMLRTAVSDKNKTYHDHKEGSWAERDAGTYEPKSIPVEELSEHQKEMYEVASKFKKILQAGGPTAITDIVPASSLPNPETSTNSYGNSYHYDRSTGKLSIRAERLEDPGEMMLILAHANAHIRCGNMNDDSSPDFQREFYKSLSGLMAKMSTEGGMSNKDGEDGFKVRPVSSEQRMQREAEGAMTEMSLAQNRRQEDDLQRRETAKATLQRRQTERKNTQMKKSGNQVNENIKARLEGGMPAQEKHKLTAQKKMVLKVFEQCDKDDNGQIDRSELYQAVQFLGAGLSEEEANVAFTSIDTNQDGGIDFEEFFNWYIGD